MKVVINKCWGGFSISKKCAELMAEMGSDRAKKELEEFKADDEYWGGYGYVEGLEGQYDRCDPILVRAVERLGEAADGHLSRLKVVEIPDGIEWYIHDYNGMESILEAHRSWG